MANSPSQIFFLHRTITNHYNLLKHLIILFKNDIKLISGSPNIFRLIANIRDFYCSPFLYSQCKITIHIRNNTIRSTSFFNHTGTDNRFSLCINHLPSHR